jgi:formamidopyrimidine-DNA glycosylase
MPELPEVETVVRGLRRLLPGRTVADVTLGPHTVVRHPQGDAFAGAIRGRTWSGVERRGKFIRCRMAGTADELIVHLGMTGHLIVTEAAAEPAPHTHFRMQLDGGHELRFDDARRFGRVLLGPWDALVQAALLPALGMEPLGREFDRQLFHARLRKTERNVKAVLLDQAFVAGLGNIYVDEICHLAGVRPARRASSLTRTQRDALFDHTPAVLRQAIRNRGTTISDYRDAWNAEGTNQERLLAYGRGGLPCLSCGTAMRKSVVAGRGTTHCPRCQK